MNTASIEVPIQTATLHLTQIRVSYERAIQKLRVRDRYGWHKQVWEAFAGLIPPNPNKGRFAKGTRTENQPKTPPDFLCRLDEKEGGYRVLILSRTPPRKPDWCPTDCFQSKVIPDDFFAQMRYRFSLLANPTHKPVKDKDGNYIADAKKRKRRAITKREDLVAWLERKAASSGFVINPDPLRTIPRGREFFHKDGTAHGSHTAVEFQGELTVTDPAQFRVTVAAGIGSAKAFGFGLLVLAPIS